MRILDSYETVSKAGHEMVTVIMEVTGGPEAGTEIWEHFVLEHPVAARRWRDLLSATHSNPNSTPESLIGKRLLAVVGHESYKSKLKPKALNFIIPHTRTRST